MAKLPTEPLEVVGFYLPRKPVDWTGEILDLKTGELVKEPSMTKQSFKEECDINTIVKRFESGQAIDHINQAAHLGYFEDLPSGLDLQMALEMATKAEQAFMALSADVRARFANDAVQFMAFMDDPSNQEEIIKLGLAKDTRPPPPQKPMQVEVVVPKPIEGSPKSADK